MIDSGEHDAPPTALELAQELSDYLNNSVLWTYDRKNSLAVARLKVTRLVSALTPPPTHPAPDPDISGIDWKD